MSGPKNSKRKEPFYTITRDGFTLLVMGFSGYKARKFKIAYLQAFNAMEAALLKKQSTPPALPPPRPATKKQRERLVSLVNEWIRAERLPAHIAWGKVCARFGAAAVKELTPAQVRQACDWVCQLVDTAFLGNVIAGNKEILRNAQEVIRELQRHTEKMAGRYEGITSQERLQDAVKSSSRLQEVTG